MNNDRGTLEQMLARLPDPRHRRYAYRLDRERRAVLFTRGGKQAVATETAGGLIRVTYESTTHVATEETCTPLQAATLIAAIMSRKGLCLIPKPAADPEGRTDSGES
jgi:hypothetical protein